MTVTKLPQTIATASRTLYSYGPDGNKFIKGETYYTQYNDGRIRWERALLSGGNGVAEYDGGGILSVEAAAEIQKELYFYPIKPDTESSRRSSRPETDGGLY